MVDAYWDKVRQDTEKARADRMKDAAPAPDKEHSTKRGAGKRLWVCADCKAESWEHWIRLNRAARPRCPSCGSLRYEMKTKEAKDDAASLRGVREEFRKNLPGTGEGKFIINNDGKS